MSLTALIIILVVVGIIVVLGLVLVGMYNGLVQSRLRVREAWSGIDVQLKRRASLIPNLVETVKGYATHEREVFENVTRARAMLQQAGSPGQAADANNFLTQTLRSLFAVAEAYPDLKANQNFLELQQELSDTEDKIAYARQFYNSNVLSYNTKTATFPSLIFANMFNFQPEEFFEVEEEAREDVRVSFLDAACYAACYASGTQRLTPMAGTEPLPAPAERVLIYDRIASNKRRTWLLMFAFVLFLGVFAAFVGLALGMPWQVAPFLFAGLAAYAGVSYYASASVALAVSGAREVAKADEPDLYRVVENLSIGSGLPMPKVYVIDDTAPNAFATGRDPKHASVAATRGLVDKLDKAELEAVMAHEMSHVGNYDIRVMTIVVVLVGLVALLADFFMRWAWFGAGTRGSNRDKGGGSTAIFAVVAIALAIMAPLAAQLIQMAISRQREYLADASGALLCRNPDALARALEKIAADPEPLEVANKATAHLYISNPLKEHQSFLNNFFSTHPPVADRIRLLRAM